MTLFGRTIHDDISDRGLGVVTVQRALEKSSDVGAVKMALKLGNDKFYKYIKGVWVWRPDAGLSCRARRAGCCGLRTGGARPAFVSMAIGQEIGVTPVQLVTHGEHDCEWRRVPAAAYPAELDR